MAAYDIMPLSSALGGHTTIRWGSMTASEVFDVGEPVNIVNAGTLTEPPDDATQWIIADFTSAGDANEGGIAVFGPAGGVQTDDHEARLDPETGNAFAALANVAFYPIGEGNLFITSKFWAAGAGSAVVPAQTDVGEGYQITYATFGTPDAGWGVEQTAGVAGVDVVANITEVLDSRFQPIRISGNAGVHVVFTITATTAGV